MGGRDQKFSRNVDLMSLCVMHSTTVKEYDIDHWLNDGDVISLNDAAPNPLETLHV